MSRDNSNRRRPESMSPMGFGGARVYVGDIGHRMGRGDLQREFEQFGQVLDVWMKMTSNDDSRFEDKKFAFVVFRHQEDAEIAVREKNGRHVCGRKVTVEHAKPPKPNVMGNRNHFDYPSRGGDGDRGRGGGRYGSFYSGGYNRGGRGRGGGFYRGRGRGGGGGGNYYNSMGPRQQPPPPRGNRYRSRSFSPRERDRQYRRSPPPRSPPRNSHRGSSPYDGGRYQDRNRDVNYSDYSPDRRVRHPSSFSPEDRSRKPAMKKSTRPVSHSSLSPSPPPRQQLQHHPHSGDNGSFVSRSRSRSLSPPPSKKSKKKKKKHTRSQSFTPSASPSSRSCSPRNPEPRRPMSGQSPPPQEQQQRYYSSEDDGEYEKRSKSHKSKKSKSKKKKKRDIESGEEYSSDGGY